MKPKGYQLKAVDSLRSGSILCGGVGSGKSFTSLLYFWIKEMDGTIELDYPSEDKKKDLYIITTARKRDTGEWEDECLSFGISTTIESPIKVVIDSWNNIKKYIDIKDSFFIFDEQRVVGSGEWVKSFLKITKQNRWILLSATPGDTWMDYIPVFIANGYYKNRTAFLREHAVFNRYSRYPKIDKYINERKLILLRNSILVDMDYVKKTKRHHYWIKTQYDPNLYSRVWKDRWNIFEDKPIENVSELFMCLRRVVNDTHDRFDILNEILKLHDRVIIFYNFNYELETLKEYCESIGIPYSEWNGHTHQIIPDSRRWIYLVQYTAGAEGWNCVETNTIIFWSLNYSYKILEQSCGRIDRLNTPFVDLYYYHIYTSSNIDQAIRKALVNKKSFNEKIFIEAQKKHVA